MVTATLRRSKKCIPGIMVFFLFVIMSISMVQGAVLSIDQANIRSNYFGFDEAWIVSFVSDDYTTDSLNAYLTPQAIEDASGLEPEQALQIKVDTKPNYCTYSFKTNTFSYQDIYTIQEKTFYKWIWGDGDAQELTDEINSICADFSKLNYKSNAVYDSSSNKLTTGDYVHVDAGNYIIAKKVNVYCSQLNEKIGTIAQPIDKRIIAETDWTVGVEGKTSESKTISNSEAGDGRSTKLGDNVWVQWQGNLGTGEDCPDVSNLIGVHDNSFFNGWKIGSRDDYNTYSSYITSGIINDIELFSQSTSTQSYSFEDRANAIVRDVVDEESGFVYSVLDTSYSSGKVRIDLGRQIVFPLFRLIIDADYLEIVIPTGEPSIVSVSDIEFTEGLAGQVTAVIKNIGEGKAGFTTRIKDCTNGFSSSTAPTGSILDVDQIETLYFNVIGSSTAEEQVVNGVCTLEVKESITGEIATKIFGVKMSQLQQCVPGTVACSVDDLGNSVVKKCNTAGTKYEIIETCPEGQECRLTISGAECVEIDGDDDDDVFYCEDCDAFARNLIFGKIFKSQECIKKTFQNSLLCIWSILKLFAVPFIFIFSLLFGVQILNKLLKGKNKGLVWAISIILSLLVAWLTYILFWLGIVILIIYGIFRVAVNFIPGLNVRRKR